MKEYKDSGNCTITNPEFYTLWKWDDPNKIEDEETKRFKREKRLKVREVLKETL